MHTLVSGDMTIRLLKAQLLSTMKQKIIIKKKKKRSWYLGNDIVAESENYKHLGDNNNKYLNNKISIQDETHKLLKRYFSQSS